MLAQLAAHNVEKIDGRQLEQWSQVGLLPPDGTPAPALAAHVLELRKVYRPGPGAADRAMLVMAARGHACTGLYGAIRRAARPEDTPTTAWPDPETDEGDRAIHAEAQALYKATQHDDLPAEARDLLPPHVNRAARNARRFPVIDYLTHTAASPEGVVISGLAQVLALAYGEPGAIVDPETVARFGPPEPRELRDLQTELDEAAPMLEAISGILPRVDALYRHLEEIPLADLVAGARAIRPFVLDERLAGILAVAGVALLRALPAVNFVELTTPSWAQPQKLGRRGQPQLRPVPVTDQSQVRDGGVVTKV